MKIPRRSCITLVCSAVCLSLCVSAAAQEGYYGVGHDKWHQGFYSTLKEMTYVLAGFTCNRANHNRLMRRPRVKDRIDVLRREREAAARAARVPIDQVLEEMARRGLARIEDFFERNAAY